MLAMRFRKGTISILELYPMTWLTTDISIEKPKKEPFWGMDAFAGTAFVVWMLNVVGNAVGPGGAGAFRMTGLYAS
jgi:hypothetical protein